MRAPRCRIGLPTLAALIFSAAIGRAAEDELAGASGAAEGRVTEALGLLEVARGEPLAGLLDQARERPPAEDVAKSHHTRLLRPTAGGGRRGVRGGSCLSTSDGAAVKGASPPSSARTLTA